MATPEDDAKKLFPKQTQQARRKTLFSFDPSSKRDTVAIEANSKTSYIVSKVAAAGRQDSERAVPKTTRSRWASRGAISQRKKGNHSKKHHLPPHSPAPGSLVRGLSLDSSQRVSLPAEPARALDNSSSNSEEGGRLGTSLDYSEKPEANDSGREKSTSRHNEETTSNQPKTRSKKVRAKQPKLKGVAGSKEKVAEGVVVEGDVVSPSSPAKKGANAQPQLAHPLTKDLPPTEEWPHYPLLVRSSPQTNATIARAHVGSKYSDMNLLGGKHNNNSSNSSGENISSDSKKSTSKHKASNDNNASSDSSSSSSNATILLPLGSLPINHDPFAFETPLFKGHVMIRLADLPSSSADYFEGKKRKLQVCVQGVFKQRLRFDQVLSGQEFNQPLRRVPAKPFVKWVFDILRTRLPPTLHADLFGALPFVLSPLVLASKVVRCDPVATCHPPPVTDFDFQEDMNYHIAQMADPVKRDKATMAFTKASSASKKKAPGLSLKAREHAFSSPSELASQYYEPGVVYTFDYFDSFFRADCFHLDLKVSKLDLVPIVGAQPLVMTMARHADTGEYLWKFEIWHARSLSLDQPQLQQAKKGKDL